MEEVYIKLEEELGREPTEDEVIDYYSGLIDYYHDYFKDRDIP